MILKTNICTFLKKKHENLAETEVVKVMVLSMNVSGVVPVMSSHCEGDVPPKVVVVE